MGLGPIGAHAVPLRLTACLPFHRAQVHRRQAVSGVLPRAVGSRLSVAGLSILAGFSIVPERAYKRHVSALALPSCVVREFPCELRAPCLQVCASGAPRQALCAPVSAPRGLCRASCLPFLPPY